MKKGGNELRIPRICPEVSGYEKTKIRIVKTDKLLMKKLRIIRPLVDWYIRVIRNSFPPIIF
jgi:hypothetical protein